MESNTYAVEIKRSAQKDLAKIRQQDRQNIEAAIDALAYNPRPHGYEPVKTTPFFKIRVGDYRVWYSINDKALLVLVVQVVNRKEAYTKKGKRGMS